MKEFNSKLKKWHIVLIVLFLLFMPFPTEMIPEWKMLVVDNKNKPLSNVRTEQNWKNYTFFATQGYDSKCTNSKGKVVYPSRYLWAGTLSRIVSPLWANVMTLAHGGTGTSAHIVLADPHYSSDFIYWREREKIYSREREPLPEKIVAKQREFDNYEGCK